MKRREGRGEPATPGTVTLPLVTYCHSAKNLVLRKTLLLTIFPEDKQANVASHWCTCAVAVATKALTHLSCHPSGSRDRQG